LPQLSAMQEILEQVSALNFYVYVIIR